MNRKWTISIVISCLIAGITIFSLFTVKNEVASGITEEQSYLLFDELDEQQLLFIQQLKQSREEALFDAQKKVVQLETPIGSTGSGFLYTREGHIVTNAHVVANATDVTVITADSAKYEGTVIGISQEVDVAVVKVDDLVGQEPLQVEREKRTKLQDPILAMGSPLGFQNTVTAGVVNAKDRAFEIDPFVYDHVDQITAAISPGSSGGPLLNADSMQVVGINSAEDRRDEVGFSIPIVDVLPLIDGWIAEPIESVPYFPQFAEQPDRDAVDSAEDLAQYLVEFYYNSLQFNDYVTAYSLLGSEYQESTSYEEYRESYLPISSITMENPETFPVAGQVEVRVTVKFEDNTDNVRRNVTQTVSLLVGKENDRLKIKRVTRQ